MAEESAPPMAHQSSDGGLSGLGLIMQLVGNVMTAVVGCYGLITVFMLLEMGGRGGGSGNFVFMLVVIATSLARSIVHAAAGRSLLYELGAGTPMGSLDRYLAISVVHVAVVAGGMLISDAPGAMILAIALMLAAWPVALAMIARSKITEHGNVVPMADDKGFEGASILLLIFGCIGVGIGAVMLLGWLDYPGEMKASLMGVGMLVTFAVLLVRSVLHLRAGLRGSSARLMAETAEAAEKYASFGVIAAVVSGGVFLVSMYSLMGGRGGGGLVMLMMLFMVVMITWVLLVWPLTVRRFFSDRQFATMVDERAPAQQASTDRGLPTLGWLLLAFGSFAFASSVGGLLISNMADDGGGMRASRGNPFGEMTSLMGNVGGKSPWFGVVTAVLQVWAGVELIRLSSRFKIIGMVFGGVASAIALYVYMPLMGDFMSGGLAMLSNPLVGMMFASVMMALVVPVATFIFVQRKVRDPQALARTFA